MNNKENANKQREIVRGKEPSVLLKHAQRWLDSFKNQKDRNVQVFKGPPIGGPPFTITYIYIYI